MKKILPWVLLSLLAIIFLLPFKNWRERENSENESEEHGFDEPGKFTEYFDAIKNGAEGSTANYPVNYQFVELKKAQLVLKSLNLASPRLNWIERGPGNIGGRTRGLILDPSDASGNTWFAGSAGGGIWKTTDAGKNWRNLTENFPNLSTSCLEMAASNNKVMYAGTGELQSGATGTIKGCGIFISSDRGENWDLLSATSNNNFSYVHKIIVDPKNENILIVSTNAGIFKSGDAGTSWRKVFSDGGLAQCLIPDPGDFSVIYASIKRNGIIKSENAGESWKYVFRNGDGRIEMDISKNNPQLIYALTDSSKIYISNDKGLHWQNGIPDGDPSKFKFLGDQGWWNNSIRINPLNDQKVFIGGIDLYQVEITGVSGTTLTYTVDTLNTGSFLSFVDFSNPKKRYLKGIILETDSANFVPFEIRFGANKKQKAHRFLVPEGSTSGVPDNQFTYQDYVDVPFEVWNTAKSEKLMVSFRDQDRNGLFNLTVLDDILKIGREYIYVHSIPYSENPSELVKITGGQKVQNIGYIWAVLPAAGVWNPDNLPVSTLTVNKSVVNNLSYSASHLTRWSDSRTSSRYLHADIHNIQITTKTGSPFKLVVASDGGIAYSEDGGTNWINPLRGYNTAQFYGVDRHPTLDQYIGGMQDNGSWYSGNNPSKTSDWSNATGGDGFETVWHSQIPNKIITSLYYNQLYRTINGGTNWYAVTFSTSKNVGDTKAPFVTRIASSPSYPERIFIAGKDGVSKSVNFGQTWQDITIPSNWDFSGVAQLKVSAANPDVVWAGCRMSGTSRMFVSTDGGDTFKATSGYPVSLGTISGIATHPSNPQTAFALFSFAGLPKILRTDDLGQNWVDISGFAGGGTGSFGFPDVAVYSLLVLDTTPEEIWAGTEIGLFISRDNGKSWFYANNGLPAVSIWEMKRKGNQVMVATHGRGVWSANLDEVVSSGNIPKEINGNKETNGYTVYPNPCSEYVNIQFSVTPTGKVIAEIQSMEGMTILQKEIFPNGTGPLKFSLPKLPVGHYILTIKQKSGVQAKVISVQ